MAISCRQPSKLVTIMEEEQSFFIGSSQSFKMSSHWSDLGHLAIPEPITVVRRMDCLDWSGWVMCQPMELRALSGRESDEGELLGNKNKSCKPTIKLKGKLETG